MNCIKIWKRSNYGRFKNFIKTLNVLYVEDEDSAREITAKNA